MQPGNYSKKLDRRLVEKHRRLKMKNLYSRLASLVSSSTFESNHQKLAILSQLDQSVEYVNHLKERVDLLKARKGQLQGESSKEGLLQPALLINEKGPILEVNLATGSNMGFMLHEVISILEEEGAQILSAYYSTWTDRNLYTITSQAVDLLILPSPLESAYRLQECLSG